MTLWYRHLDQPIPAETALMKRNQQAPPGQTLTAAGAATGLHQAGELLWWINPCSIWCWASTDLHNPSWPRKLPQRGTADVCKGDVARRVQTTGECGGSLCFAEFSVCKGERWRMRRVMLWGLIGSWRRRRGEGELKENWSGSCKTDADGKADSGVTQHLF